MSSQPEGDPCGGEATAEERHVDGELLEGEALLAVVDVERHGDGAGKQHDESDREHGHGGDAVVGVGRGGSEQVQADDDHEPLDAEHCLLGLGELVEASEVAGDIELTAAQVGELTDHVEADQHHGKGGGGKGVLHGVLLWVEIGCRRT